MPTSHDYLNFVYRLTNHYNSGGIGKIDIADWKNNTRLKHCSLDTPVVKWFWEIVENYSEEMRARLLQFVTGSSRVSIFHFI